MEQMRLPIACPYPAGHDMPDKFVVSWLNRSEHALVLLELIDAWRNMPVDYMPRAESELRVAELVALVDSLGASPF